MHGVERRAMNRGFGDAEPLERTLGAVLPMIAYGGEREIRIGMFYTLPWREAVRRVFEG